MPNRLADETSPYLLQHAHNPVDWYPWGDEALELARDHDKPIFLSVGYSACHWCHVMERESFEDPAIAQVLNEHFVCIKVDREERPDVDNIYMEAVQVMTGQGGWPMSVWLTPQLEPFYAGTYFPPRDRWGRPGFASVLGQLIAIWNDDRDRIETITGQVTDRLRAIARRSAAGSLSLAPLRGAYEQLEAGFDTTDAGFGTAPKFPPSMGLRLLLHVWRGTPESEGLFDSEERKRALHMVEATLERMALGGMYDHLGGGYHRYSTDNRWLVPHFEKMLYDNALLTRANTEAFQATSGEHYARWIRETVRWLLREMTLEDDRGCPFFATQDADSEGEEGKFFVWTPDEVRDVLGDDADSACAFWGIAKGGNFEGKSIPNRLHAGVELPDHARMWRDSLFAARAERVAPATDQKIVAAWNGLMIGALARAGRVLGEQGWIDAAASAARFLLDVMHDGEFLHRIYKDDRVRFPGYLDDYACVCAALVDLFEVSGDAMWLERAESLVDELVEHFWDDDGAGFFYAGPHHTDLIVRQKEGHDGATPASNSSAIDAVLRVAILRGRLDLRDLVDRALRVFVPQMKRAPMSLPEMIQSLHRHLDPQEWVVVGAADDTTLADAMWRRFEPNVLRVVVPGDGALEECVPLTRGKVARQGRPTLYACREGACEAPRFSVAVTGE
jgi:uncharacterized protein YyaL (SSP411 family)